MHGYSSGPTPQVPEVVQRRLEQLDALANEIDSIPDGVNVARRPLRPIQEAPRGLFGFGKKAPAMLGEIQLSDLNQNDPELDPAYYQVSSAL